ncbi:AsmA-like C-terminal region-containing protein [Allomesorhizobium camelthorni]|uniref:AsmA family protein n=1 Tax=Allomesorhizobium camelthorni TaxID=475069 RepID=A0A6G4WJH9_9HYPH|nr:AsmA family protein [Mesorhizobium camelthorni]
MLARLFVIIGGLIVLALTAALVGPYFVDWTSYRADFEREASAILGRKVTVEGAASARLLPFPSVTFSDVSVGGGSSDAPAMTIETFSMDAELAPFLRGEFLIFDMRMVRPKVTVDVAADGTVDWTVRPSTPFRASQISLERLTVNDGQIAVRHAASGRTHALSEINAEISARSFAGPWRADGTMRMDGTPTALAVSTGVADDAGRMRLRIKAEPQQYGIAIETDGNVRIENGAATYAGVFKIAGGKGEAESLRGSDGQPVKVGALEGDPGYRINGRFTFDHKRLGIDEFRFETGPLDNPYTADGTAFVEIDAEPRFLVETSGAQVRFDEAVGAEEGAKLSLSQRIAALEAALTGLPRPAIPGAVNVDLPAVVVGDTTIRNVRLSAEPADGGWNLKSLGATLPGRTTLEADGLLRTEGEFGFDGSLLLAINQPSGFAAWVAKDVDDAIRRLPAAGFKAEVEMTKQRQLFSDLELVLGDAVFHGSIDSRQPANLRPSVLLKLDGKALDVDGLTAFASLFVSDQGANRFADRDLDFQIKAGPVNAGGLTAETVDTALRLRSGVLEIDRLAIGGLAGASVSATGTVKGFPENPTGNLDASVVAVDLASLVSLAAARYPDNPLLAGLDKRAEAYPGLLADTRIDLIASAASNDDGTTGLALSVQGDAGGSAISATLSGSAKAGAVGEGDLSLSLSARNDDATSLMGLAGLPALPLGAVGPGEMTLSAKGEPAAGMEMAFTLSGDDFHASFKGISSFGDQGLAAKGRAELESADLEPWLMTGGISLPGMGLGMPVALAAEADYADGLLVLAGLNGTANENAVSGDVNAEISEGVPHLTGALALDALDLEPAAAMLLGESALAPEAEGGWPSVPFQPKSAAPFTAEMDISAGTLSAGAAASAYDTTMTFRLDAEGMRVSDLKGKLFGGDLAGLLELKNNGGTGLFSGQLSLTGADLETALPDAGLSGAGDFSTALSASGKSVGGMVAALSGSGTAALKELTIAGLNSQAFPAFIARADTIGRDIDAARTAGFAPEIAAGGDFSAKGAEIAFTVAGGVLRAPPVSLENQDATVTADVRADLNTREVAVEGTIAYKPGDEALAGSEPSLRFHLQGRPSEAERVFDSEPLAQFLTQRALEREQARVEAMQAELLEKQRLRREVRYYAALQAERERAAEQARVAEEARLRALTEAARAEEEARLKAEAEEKARLEAEEKARLETEAKARAEEEARRAAEEAANEAARRKAEQEARRAADEQARREAEETPPAEIERTPLPEPRADGPAAVIPPEPTRPAPNTIESFIRSLQNPE